MGVLVPSATHTVFVAQERANGDCPSDVESRAGRVAEREECPKCATPYAFLFVGEMSGKPLRDFGEVKIDPQQQQKKGQQQQHKCVRRFCVPALRAFLRGVRKVRKLASE